MSDVDTYLKKVDQPEQAELERIRQIVMQMFPEAEEVISYGMPGFKYKGKYLVGYAAFKDHLSLFPTNNPIAVLKDKLSDYRLAKGTIQFTLDKPLPEELIKEIVLTRAKTIDR